MAQVAGMRYVLRDSCRSDPISLMSGVDCCRASDAIVLSLTDTEWCSCFCFPSCCRCRSCCFCSSTCWRSRVARRGDATNAVNGETGVENCWGTICEDYMTKGRDWELRTQQDIHRFRGTWKPVYKKYIQFWNANIMLYLYILTLFKINHYSATFNSYIYILILFSLCKWIGFNFNLHLISYNV